MSPNQILLTSYNIPEELEKETFTNNNDKLRIDYQQLMVSPRFRPLVLERTGVSFVGGNVSQFSAEHIFKFRLEVTPDALYVTETLIKEDVIVAGYDSPVIYKRAKEETEVKQ
jgi:hypothetical protein